MNVSDHKYNHWKEIVGLWAKRHNISFDSAVSILSDDSPYNPDDPSKDLVTYREVASCVYDDCSARYLNGG